MIDNLRVGKSKQVKEEEESPDLTYIGAKATVSVGSTRAVDNSLKARAFSDKAIEAIMSGKSVMRTIRRAGLLNVVESETWEGKE